MRKYLTSDIMNLNVFRNNFISSLTNSRSPFKVLNPQLPTVHYKVWLSGLSMPKLVATIVYVCVLSGVRVCTDGRGGDE